MKRLSIFFLLGFFTHEFLSCGQTSLNNQIIDSGTDGDFSKIVSSIKRKVKSKPKFKNFKTSSVLPSEESSDVTLNPLFMYPRQKLYESTRKYMSPKATMHFVTAGLPSTRAPSYTTAKTASTPYPCLYGICNGTCCKADSVETFFDCANGKKINKSLVCNRVNDCEDGSDESDCTPWPPKITVLPKLKVDVYCKDQDQQNSETLILECESVGHPTPLIRWKKFEGHIPSKCQQYSKRGHGILTCPNFQQSDQGAYSCVAENSVKSAESQPKSIAKCRNSIKCNGFKVFNDGQIEHCLECYCSGKTSQCQNIKSNTTTIEIPFPEVPIEIFAKDDGQVVFIPTKTKLVPGAEVRQSSHEITYCSLSETYFKETSFLKSFGRSIIIPRYKGKTDFLTKAPDLIIRGNNLSLMYTANLLTSSKDSVTVLSGRFWPGNWHHLDKKPATRKDLMKVLSKVDSLLVRCEYQQGQTLNWTANATIFVESSVITDSTNSVSYVEKCNCPSGYDGLSCETCAEGYTKKPRGNDFVCEKNDIPQPICEEKYLGANCSTCDTLKDCQKGRNVSALQERPTCHPDGSSSVLFDFSRKCTCKEGVTGDLCDSCKNDSFYLHKARGCLKCWCSGITNQCASSSLYRTVISNTPSGGYNSSDGRNFWLLPSEFNGNRLTSYGGYLNYTMKHKPNIKTGKPYLTVEFLSKDDVTLIYVHSNLTESSFKSKKSWSVPLTEIGWKKPDMTTVTRGEFLTVLSKIKAIYIESPHHLSSGKSNLTSTLISSTSSKGDDETDLALEVEQCSCPRGYTGLSCESCSEGYYRKRNATVFQCIKCNCSYCDPEFGCGDCPQLTYRDNPEDEKVPVCKPCPCNGNGVSCLKDDFNQTFCRCKSGFSGMHCENAIPKENDFITVSISPTKIKRKKVGNTVSFNCSLTSNEEMFLVAMKISSTNNSEKNNESIIFTGQGSKISKSFEVVLEVGLKAVVCYLYDSQWRLAGHVGAAIEDLITVIEPVKISNCYSDRIDVKESEVKEIICEATGSPKPTITWYRTKKGSPAERVDTTEGVHTIKSASLQDNGTIFTCIAENAEEDKATCAKVLIVKKKCEVIHIFPKYVREVEGKNISIKCKTTAKTSVSWTKLHSFLDSELPITSTKARVENGFLHITDASVSDSGTYVCSATGENGIINSKISVVVDEKRVPPTVYILEYDKVLKINESFEVECLATGKPTPTVTWTKTNDSLGSNVFVSKQTLKIYQATKENSGLYECTAKSSSGNASSYILIKVENSPLPPKVNISADNVNPYEGEEVIVKCLAIGFPRPQLSWLAPDVNFTLKMRENDKMILIEPYKSIKEEIVLKVPKGTDELTVTCIADNQGGKDTTSTKIKVLQTKDLINETAEFVPIGSYFEVRCEFDGELSWEKLDSSFVGDECPIPNSLMIPSVQIQHNGTYICKSGPNLKKIINLIVNGFVPKFSKAFNSYLVLSAQVKSPNEIRIEMSFSPTRENGLLLQKENEKLSIYLEKKEIHVSLYSKENDLLDIAVNKVLQLGTWYSLVVSVIGNQVDITIYDEKTSVYARKTERQANFSIALGFGVDNFFIGGPIPKRFMKRMIWRHLHHFDGCISRLSIDRHEYDMVKEGSHSHNVTLCRRCLENPNICSEKGKCLDAPTQYGFICICPREVNSQSCSPSCFKKGCETQLDLCALLNPCSGFPHQCINEIQWLKCNCAYGYTGTTCDREQKYSFCASGNGYVRLPSNLFQRRLGVKEIIRMSFTLSNLNGQLLWQGDRANYLSIAVRGGKIHYVYLNQHSKMEIHGVQELELNKKYLVSLITVNKSTFMELRTSEGSLLDVQRNSTSEIHTNRVIGDIYLGNVPNNTHYVGHPVGLNGCFHYISVGENPKINLPEKSLESVNVSLYPKLYIKNYDDSEEFVSSNDVDY